MLQHPLESGESFTLLALNYYLPSFFGELWDKAKTRVCADGGANRVADFFKDQDFKKPSFVVGDFDSVRPNVMSEFKKCGTEFVKAYDQDYSDVQKSLLMIHNRKLSDPVVVVGAFGGRMDHTIGSLHAALGRPELRVFFLDESNFATWIRPGDKGIKCPQKWTTKMCGLIPIAKPVRKVTTKGLKWECDFELAMGGLISSSNEIAAGANEVLINTSDPVLWTNQTSKRIKH